MAKLVLTDLERVRLKEAAAMALEIEDCPDARHRKKRQTAAIAALSGMGIQPPDDFEKFEE
jgi:hypothetical protein